MHQVQRRTVIIARIVVYSLGTLATPLANGFADLFAYRLVGELGWRAAGFWQFGALPWAGVLALVLVRPGRLQDR